VTNYNRDIRGFNDFITKTDLVDIPMVGRKFTWYEPNGSVKSRIDRILVLREWLEVWPDSKQFIISRLVFDHCALVLKDLHMDWGLKPFTSLDVWYRDGRFKDFVRSKWLSYEVKGGGITLNNSVIIDLSRWLDVYTTCSNMQMILCSFAKQKLKAYLT